MKLNERGLARAQELIADRTTPEGFVATVQEDWDAFHADR